MKTFLAGAAILFVACGGSTPSGDASTGDGSISDASTGDGPNLQGTYACGATTCQSGEYCVHPCCGGAPPPCTPLPDSGMCPSNMVYQANCFNPFKGPGCQPPPCTPPPPYCAATGACISPNMSRDAYCACG